MAEHGADAFIISHSANLRYYSGFTGDSSLLIVTADVCRLVTDSRYTEQAEKEAPLFTVVQQTEGLLTEAANVLKQLGAKKIAFEGRDISFDHYAKLKELYPAGEFVSVSPDAPRMIKDEGEIECIREACRIADTAFALVLPLIKPGIAEREIAAELEHLMRREGAERAAFDTIVASGVRGSLPHGRAGEKLIKSGEFVTMDFGAVYRGYHSDTTRTVCVGKADARQREVYEAVLTAQFMALDAIRPGKSGVEIDAVARNYLKSKELDQYFGHGLGHSLGLMIHEEPRLSPRSQLKALESGMLVTDEPGVYIPDWGGVRIEDTVLVTGEGGEALTHSPKELLEL